MIINIFTTVIALFIFTVIVTPLILLTILIVRTSKKPPTINKERIDALEQNDSIIVEDINTALTELVTRLTELEEKVDREEATVKGFGSKK
jgi:ABC-type multidrug transport system fused ATPase/permease subunit